MTSSNGRSDLLGRVLGGSGQGLAPGQCRALGVGDSGPGLGAGRSPLVQELSELEAQILVIKQQLQSAMRRKRELEQYQSETPPGPPQSNPLSAFTGQYTNAPPDF